MLEPSIVGSLPKPSWLAQPNILRAPWRLAGPELIDAQNDAVRLAILDQELAGLTTVTDGEVRRRHYIWGFLDGLTGIDTDRLAVARSRAGRYSESTEVARIIGPVERKGPVLLDACQFARGTTTCKLKVTMPGPMTIVDSVADEHYGTDRKTLAMIVGTLAALVFIYFSPTIQVDILHNQSAWFPLRNPGIASIPLSFIVAIAVSLLWPVPSESRRYAELERQLLLGVEGVDEPARSTVRA